MHILLTSLLLFVAYFVYDLLYAKWTEYVVTKRPYLAAHASVGIYLIGSWGIILYVANPWLLIPIILGAWLGTYVAVKRSR